MAQPGQPRQPGQGAVARQGLVFGVAQALAQVHGDRPVQLGKHGAGRQPIEALGAEKGA